MYFILTAQELDDLGLWESFVKLRVGSDTYVKWQTVTKDDEFELSKVEMKKLGIDITVDSKHREDLGIMVMCNHCKVYFSIYIKDIDKFWFCPSCGDKIDVV